MLNVARSRHRRADNLRFSFLCFLLFFPVFAFPARVRRKTLVGRKADAPARTDRRRDARLCLVSTGGRKKRKKKKKSRKKDETS